MHLVLAALIGAVVGAGAVGVAWGITGGSRHTARQTPTATPSRVMHRTPTTFVLTGTFELTDGVVGDGAGGCKGSEGYSDISEGTAVTVYDAAGTVVATGGLGESTRAGSTCRFDVAVSDVPTGKRFYKVEVSHRGTVQLTEAEARGGGFGATLG
ncbi:hypothetical protein [Streptomyces panaciradicis]|uniref:hypothetical protein n=1 Tax=Streptomyces panaciradicis TaxID=1470261 RepID=UPI00201D266B|nr:hypothetical protein [Streptomyces panaciradicis]MCL6675115.1 hypothetical protein [Streptomyces panaciradicis]